MRHRSKRFAFPSDGLSAEDKALLKKPLKQYTQELQQAKELLKERTRLRKRGKIVSDVNNCQVPEMGQLLGGMRYDILKKTKKIKDQVNFSN